MNQLPQLQAGDKIAIVAFAKKISRSEIQDAVNAFNSWGLEVEIGQTIGAEWNQFGGNDELRKNDLQNYINNPEIKAIISARGGYGSVRIIDEIDFSPLQSHPKWIIGFSDITVFHNTLNSSYNYPTLHATMPVFFPTNTEKAIASLKSVLFDLEIDYQTESELPQFCKNGEAHAEIVGGNLSIIYSLCGSASQLDTKGKILFLEDLSEYLYHTDRMLQNLKRNGMFEGISGLLVGGFTNMKDGPIPFGKSVEELIFEYVQHLDIPIFTGFPAGHIENNHAIIMGSKVELKVEAGELNLVWKPKSSIC